LWADELRLRVGVHRLVRPDSADSADDSLMMIIAGRVQADDKDPAIKDARRFLVASVTWVSGVCWAVSECSAVLIVAVITAVTRVWRACRDDQFRTF